MDKERKEKTARVQDAEADGIIEGRNAVIEALRAGTTIDKIFIQKGETDKTLGHIASTARAAGVVVVDADKRKLDFMSRTHAHQGVIALTSVREYVSVEDILNIAREKGENPLTKPRDCGIIVEILRRSNTQFIMDGDSSDGNIPYRCCVNRIMK